MAAQRAPLADAARLAVSCGCSHHTDCMDALGLHNREAMAHALGLLKAKMHLKSFSCISEPMLYGFV